MYVYAYVYMKPLVSSGGWGVMNAAGNHVLHDLDYPCI